MTFGKIGTLIPIALIALISGSAHALTEGSISGTLTDHQGIAMPNVKIQLLTQGGTPLKEATTSATGDYDFSLLTFGDYTVRTQPLGFAPFESLVHVTSGGNTQIAIQLQAAPIGKELVLEVKAKRHLIQSSAAVSNTEINSDTIEKLPQGGEISLPKLIATTTPGAIQGPFGQLFFRGNHANIQYQIDGVQLPDSPSNTFGQAFSPRNIDHMEVITGGISAEYGERLAAVVNIVTKSGPEKPGGEVELNYGSYNTFSPHLLYGGSNDSGNVHYYLSANYNRTDRGLDTPQPTSEQDQTQGGTDAAHDFSSGNNEFGKIDWFIDNTNKISFVFFNSENSLQIPNYPSTFKSTDPFFAGGITDMFGNSGPNGSPVFNYSLSTADDNQFEANAYAQVVWRHTFSEHTFFQLAPYYKYSAIQVTNDPANDLITQSTTGSQPAGANGALAIPGSTPSSFAENRHVNNMGIKADYSTRPNSDHLVKAGMQFQASRSEGTISIQTDLTAPAFTDSSPNNGYFGSVYLQDDYTIFHSLILNAGVRADATQFIFSGASPVDGLIQPRIGLNYLITDQTKLHLFYGKLFQPAPVENLRNAFLATNPPAPGTPIPVYDIKAEKDDFYEAGIAQQIGDRQTVGLNIYYKTAINMLDDAQLLNTSIAQPYNFATGYAYGVELSVKGSIAQDLSEYFNYSYEIARGQGLSGGIFTGITPSSDYQYLDHVQVHTANGGLTYSKNHFWVTGQGLFGSGLRTGPNNSLSLPSHLSFDATVGYEFTREGWLNGFRVSGDVLNITNNVYPITVANGFNGSHYGAGREFFIRLARKF